MKVIETSIPGVLIFEPRVFRDTRGFFFESHNQRGFEEAVGTTYSFVQDNQSTSMDRVLRGLHFQAAPKQQGKLVRCLQGAIYDVVVDLRENSPSLGKWIGLNLSGSGIQQLWIPPGLAHGFVALEDNTVITYKTTDYYSPPHERCIMWNDPTLGIEWPIKSEPLLSDKDAKGEFFQDFLRADNRLKP